MKSDKNTWKSITVIAVVLTVLAIAMVGTSSAKSLYLVPEHHKSKFAAYNINPDGTVVYQATYTLTHSTDPSGIGMDEDSNTLFISSEFSGGVEMIDATTMTGLGVSSGPWNLAGIAVDDANDIVYSILRDTGDLYAYDWNPIARTLTLKSGYPINLPNCQGAFGIALDEKTGILWVADTRGGKVRAYNVGTWTEDSSKSFTPSHKPVDVAVDRLRGFVYTVSMKYDAFLPPLTGSHYISKYNLAMSTETLIDMGHVGVGIAVDEVTGYVYVTGGIILGTFNYDDSLEVWDTSTSTKLQDTGDLGNPAGICIPQTEVAYNPLNLTKDDGLSGACVNPGDTITYTISYTNGNPTNVTNVTITDTLPSEVTYQSCTGGCSQSGNTVTWNIGTVTSGTSGSVTLTVQVNAGTSPGTTITNYATIDSDQTPPTTVNKQTTVCSVGVTVESADSFGATKDTFQLGESVYAKGSGYAPSTTYDLYVVSDTTWTDGMAIPTRVPGTAINVTTDGTGAIAYSNLEGSGTPPALIWASSVVGKYDIVVDVNGNGQYDAGIDALDANIDVGFETIPEFPTIAIPALIVLGIIFLMFRRRGKE